MTQRHWSEPFSIGLCASPVATAWIGLAWVLAAASLIMAAVSTADVLSPAPEIAALAVWWLGACALAWGAWRWRQYLRCSWRLEVDADGGIRLDGVHVDIAPGSWSTADYAGLRLRSGSADRLIFIGPGSAPTDELRRLRRFVRWTERGRA